MVKSVAIDMNGHKQHSTDSLPFCTQRLVLSLSLTLALSLARFLFAVAFLFLFRPFVFHGAPPPLRFGGVPLFPAVPLLGDGGADVLLFGHRLALRVAVVRQ